MTRTRKLPSKHDQPNTPLSPSRGDDLLARDIGLSSRLSKGVRNITYVINYELPRSPKTYIHRIGRTGRAETPGEAISLISPDEEHHLRVIEKKMKKRVDRIKPKPV